MAASCVVANTPEACSSEVVFHQKDVEIIASYEQHVAKRYLANILGFGVTSAEDDQYSREAIQLDYLYDVIKFSAKKGYQWNQIRDVILLAKEFLEQIIGLTLPEAVGAYQELVISYSGRIKESILRSLTTYIFNTFMHHFRLYQFVLTEKRDEFLVTNELKVEPPMDIHPLQEGQPEHIHEYNQRLQLIEQEEAARTGDLHRQKESLAECSHKLQCDFGNNGELDTREMIQQTIQEAAQRQCEALEKLLQTEIEETHESLNYYLEKTALPRPEELGAPPRTRQPPNQSAKTKASAKSTVSKTTGKKGTK